MPEEQTPIEMDDRAVIEAALFLSPQPLSRRSLSKILGGVQTEYIDRLLAALARDYAAAAHGLELCVAEGRAGFRVKRAHIDRVSHLAPQQDIPRPILRSLAVIAYNHPMTQSDLVKVRGNKAYAHVQELLARNLVRAEETGRTLLLHLTAEFLKHFGLRSVEEFRFHVAPANGPGTHDPAGSQDSDEGDAFEAPPAEGGG